MKDLISDFKNLVYVAHPYGGKEENKAAVEAIMRKLTTIYPDYLFVSGVTSFGYCYADIEYQSRLDRCLWLLNQCDEMWVFGDYQSSRGCTQKIKFCQQHRIPVGFKELVMNGMKGEIKW